MKISEHFGHRAPVHIENALSTTKDTGSKCRPPKMLLPVRQAKAILELGIVLGIAHVDRLLVRRAWPGEGEFAGGAAASRRAGSPRGGPP